MQIATLVQITAALVRPRTENLQADAGNNIGCYTIIGTATMARYNRENRRTQGK
jgi:hypothetical protein